MPFVHLGVISRSLSVRRLFLFPVVLRCFCPGDLFSSPAVRLHSVICVDLLFRFTFFIFSLFLSTFIYSDHFSSNN